jgi:hypothetical protein
MTSTIPKDTGKMYLCKQNRKWFCEMIAGKKKKM